MLLELLTGLPAARPTPSHADVKELADAYWAQQSRLHAVLDSSVEWDDEVEVEFTVLAEQCLGQPNQRPKARRMLGELESLCSRMAAPEC